MSENVLGAGLAFLLFGMGLTALIAAGINYLENRKSKSSFLMLQVCCSVFTWDVGYAWMSMSYSDAAYIFRAAALLSVSLYMFYILRYVAYLANYKKKRMTVFLIVFLICSVVSWLSLIQKNAVTFENTPWGYWYTSKMSWARILQFASIMAITIYFYIILHYGKKGANTKREYYVWSRLNLFGVFLILGYFLDTLFPSIFHTSAIPGSSIGAFVSVMFLYVISRNNKSFGLSKENVSEYVFEDVTVPVIIVDDKQKIVIYNMITKTYLDCDDDALIGHSISEFFEPQKDDEEDFGEEFRDKDENVKLMHVIGDDRICRLTETHVKDKFGDLWYSIYVAQDMTQEREALRMLRESRMQAEEASKAKSNFLANMSHEIRTPMNAIIGMSDIVLQEEDVPEQIRNQVEEIQAAGNSLLVIINDILDFSKIEAGKYELIDVNYEFPSLIHDVSNIINVRVQETKVQFIVKIDPTLPAKLYGDEIRLRQIVMNILGNAVKYTKEGVIVWHIFWNKDQSDPIIYFDVMDTGIGMKPEDLKNIFGAFNQVDTRRNRNIKGTGLGLSISKHLAEMMQGDIQVESTYGQGSNFHIAVHQKIFDYKEIGEDVAKALQNHKYTSLSSDKKLQIVKRPNARVLIVDDNAVNLMVAEGIMKGYEMQIDTALSGREAIRIIEEKDYMYDIIFMDHMMPEMDGIDTTKIIRELDHRKYAEIPIVALTANAITEAKELFQNEGLQDFLAKPIDKKELDRILNQWVPVS